VDLPPNHTYQWVIAVIVMPIVLLLLKGWADSRKKKTDGVPTPTQPTTATQATLHAENSSVTNSPVASGSGNNQNLNAPVFNVHISNAAAPPKHVEPVHAAGAAYERALPNIIALAPYVAGVRLSNQGLWSEDQPMHSAFIVSFTNEARRGGQNSGGMVKAQLIYREGVRELRRITGCWLNQPEDIVPFHTDDTHSLILGLMLEQQFTVVGKRRLKVDQNTDEFPQDMIPLLGFKDGTVSVRLTSYYGGGDVLYEGQFQLSTRPPEIIRL
jgi:hypothetical protein